MSDIVEQIRRCEERLVVAKQALDVEALDQLYADDLLMTGLMGEPTCGKTAVLDEVKRGIAEREIARTTGQAFVASTDNEDMKVVTHGEMAIANYRFVVTIKGPNIDVRRCYRTTNVWTKRDGHWRIVAAHMGCVLNPKQLAMLSGEGCQP